MSTPSVSKNVGFRVSLELCDRFDSACEASGTAPSKRLRQLMHLDVLIAEGHLRGGEESTIEASLQEAFAHPDVRRKAEREKDRQRGIVA